MRHSPYLITLVSSFFLLSPSYAQETTGQIEARLVDSEGNPIPYVNVVAMGPALQGARGCLGDKNGGFVLLAMPVGAYTLRISHIAYEQLTLDGIPVRLGQTTSLGDLSLESKELRTEKVVVTGKAPILDFTSTEIGGVINAKSYETLPIERDYRNIAVLLPQANTSFLGDEPNFSGATGMDNRYFIDGVDVTDPFRGLTGTRLPYNFIQEVEVRTGGYEAEYRSSLGGIINAITYSGSNEVQGQAFGFFVNNQFAANARQSFDAKSGGYEYYDVGFGLGGPIKRDALWYYVAYNPTVEMEEVGIPAQGIHEDRSTIHSFAGKLTWRAGSRNTLVLTALGDPSTRDAVGDLTSTFRPPLALATPDPWLQEQRRGGLHFQVDDRHLLRDNLMLRGSFSWASQMYRVQPAREDLIGEPLYIDLGTATWSGGAGENFENQSRVILAGLKCTWWMGGHEVKGGLEYKDASTKSQGDYVNVIFRYPDNSHFWFRWDLGGRVVNRIGTVFVQDSWQALRQLRLNAGVRWDGLSMIDTNGSVAQKILDQWQPRIGLIWTPGERQSQKLFGTYGRFYHDLATYPTAFEYSGENGIFQGGYAYDPREDPSAPGEPVPSVIRSEVNGLQGQHYDEVTLGYERRGFTGGRVALRGIYRTLQQVLEDGHDPATGDMLWGNPGRGIMSGIPGPKRDYMGLELSWQQSVGERLALLASYTVSRSEGNYPGLFASDGEGTIPNLGQYFDWLEVTVNADGLLPNDRTHVFKLSGSYRFRRGLTLGMIGSIMSGTPLNEFGAATVNPLYLVFLRRRGTSGRTPWIWDLSLRVAYSLPFGTTGRMRPRLTADFLHIASQQEAVDFDQVHYLGVDGDGNQTGPNPTYLMATRYQPPMAVRMGLEVGF